MDRDKLWGNPDCGLKTRGVAETDASLRNMEILLVVSTYNEDMLTSRYLRESVEGSAKGLEAYHAEAKVAYEKT